MIFSDKISVKIIIFFSKSGFKYYYFWIQHHINTPNYYYLILIHGRKYSTNTQRFYTYIPTPTLHSESLRLCLCQSIYLCMYLSILINKLKFLDLYRKLYIVSNV